MATESVMPVALLAWKAVRKNTLRGFAKIRIGKYLIINDVAVHNGNGRRWATLPSKPIISSSGEVARDPETNKFRYTSMMEWSDRSIADKFSEGVIAAVERENPGATAA